LDGFVQPEFEAEWYLEEVDLKHEDQEDAGQEYVGQKDKGPGVPEVLGLSLIEDERPIVLEDVDLGKLNKICKENYK
jgi:hypothetical protein